MTEIRPNYVPTESGNPLPDLNRHPAHNEPAVSLHNSRPPAAPELAVDVRPYLPGGSELRDLILARVRARAQSEHDLIESLKRDYCCRSQHGILQTVASLINGGLLDKRASLLVIREDYPEPMNDTPQPTGASILAALAAAPDGLTSIDIAERLGITRKKAAQGLDRLHNRAAVEKARTRRSIIWRLAGDAKARKAPESTGAPPEPPVHIVGDEDDGAIPDPPTGNGAPIEHRDVWRDTSPWVVYDGKTWAGASTEAEARAIADRMGGEGIEAPVYRRFGGVRVRAEWVDDA